MPTNRPLVPARSAALFGSALLAGGGLVGCASNTWKGPRGHFAEARVMTFEHDGPLSLVSRHGRIDAATHATPMPEWALSEIDEPLPDSGLVVLAIVHGDKPEWLGGASVQPTATGEGLHFEADWDPAPVGKKKRYGVEYVVRANALSTLDVATGFGDVGVAGVDGPVRIETDFGDVGVETVYGPVTINSDFGDIVLLDIDGPIEAETDFGDVEVRPLSSSTHPMRIDSDFGDITAYLPVHFVGELVAETDFGDARTRGLQHVPGATSAGRNRIQTVRAGEGPRSTLETDFGDVTVRFED